MTEQAQQGDATTRRLVDYAMEARYETLSAATIHECKRRVIDTFASALGAFEEPLSAMARKVATRAAGNDSTVWGTSARTTAETAAFTNGVMTRLLDISDTYLGKSRGHPSDMNSALIAAAESVNADGKAFINSMVLAYDVYCSFCDSIDINSKGWDQPVYAILGAVVGVGRLLELSREQMAHAISLALAPNMALVQSRRGHLSAWKGCAGANAARNAIFAATLAKDGFTGPTAVFEGQGGLFQVLGGAFEWQLPKERMIGRTHIKGLPVCYHGQSPVWAAIELSERIDARNIESIEIDTYKAGVEMMGGDPSRWAPDTRETADHSLPYCISIALLDGKVTNDSFQAPRLRDPAVQALMRKVKVREDSRLSSLYPEGSPGRIAVQMSSGETLTREHIYPRGHAKSPISDEVLEAKFRDMASVRLGHAGCDAVLDAARNLENASDIGRDLVQRLAA